MEKKPTGWGTRIDCICEALELDALIVQLANQINQVLDTAAKPIQLPNNERIVFTQQFQCLGQSRSLSAAAADFVVENLLATRLGQGVDGV